MTVGNALVMFVPNSQNLFSLQGEQQTELQWGRALKIKFNQVSPGVFWI
jgi:hypothetical protein